MATHAIPAELGDAAEGRPVSTEQYLRTIYHPDCDYVDGRLEERNVGEYEHSIVQRALLQIFWRNEADWRLQAVQECRLQVAATRFRVPDVMVLQTAQRVHRIVEQAPLLCIEVLSPEDTWKRLSGVLGDYLAMGVEHVWAFDPEDRTAHRFDAGGFLLVTEPEMVVPGTPIRVPVAEVFSLLQPAVTRAE